MLNYNKEKTLTDYYKAAFIGNYCEYEKLPLRKPFSQNVYAAPKCLNFIHSTLKHVNPSFLIFRASQA